MTATKTVAKKATVAKAAAPTVARKVNRTPAATETKAMTKPANKTAAKTVAAKVVSKKPAAAAKPIVKAPAKRTKKVVRKPKAVKYAKRVIDVAAFATSKRIVSDLLIAKLHEAGDLMVTRDGQPEGKKLVGKALWVQLGEKKVESYGVVSDIIVSVGVDGNKIVYFLEAVCGDTTFPLHAIDKVGAKFIVDLKAGLPTRANTVLIGTDEIMGSKRPTKAPANTAAGQRAARVSRASRTANAKAEAGAEKATLVVGEHEMKPSAYAKGASIIIDPTIKGDKIAKVFIKTLGRGTKKDPVRRVRHVHTVKGQICPLNELRAHRGGFKAIDL